MSEGAPVFITGRLGVPFLQRIKNLLPEAITRAIYQTQADLEPFFKDITIVPRLTGKLQRSVVSFVSPGQIVFQWSATDEKTGFNYAKLRDILGGRFAPPDFSGRILKIAKELLMKNLIIELGAMTP